MKRHDLDVFSLVAGVVFLLVAVVRLTDLWGGTAIDGRWLTAVVLVGLGMAGLAGTVARNRRDDLPSSTSVDPGTDRPDDLV